MLYTMDMILDQHKERFPSMTSQQDQFSYLVGYMGMNKTAAYYASYSVAEDTKRQTAQHNAYVLSLHDQVSAKILKYRRLRDIEKMADNDIHTRVKQFWLDILEDETESTQSRLVASGKLGEATDMFVTKIETRSMSLNVTTQLGDAGLSIEELQAYKQHLLKIKAGREQPQAEEEDINAS